jgi:hypothetical protein|tara:strand:- start:189 stop:374 length:186 start_codon:yes stop_codon:yes gene_type:complete
MNKEYQINDILDAVDSIYKVKRKKDKNIKTNNEYAGDNELMTTGEKKSNKSDVLVLDQMIE